MWPIYFVVIVIFLMVILYKYSIKNYNYWELQGIPTARGTVPLFGHMLDIFLLRKSVITYLEEVYESHPNASMVGLYKMRKPILLVKHPELVKTIIHTEFTSFSEHVPLDVKTDPLMASDAFFSSGERWRHVRYVITKAFSTKKLKNITEIIREECDRFAKFIDKKLDGKEVVEVNAKNLFSRLTTQVSASAVFGIDGEALVDKDPPESFISMMDGVFEVKTSTGIRQNIILLLPMLSKFFQVSFAPSWVNRTFIKIANDIREFRKTREIFRDDFMQHAIDYERDGKWGEGMVNCHVFSFFAEGYETSSLTLSATAYLLSKHPDIQERARDEAVALLDKYKGLCYEAVNEMTYLDQVVHEALRLFSPAGSMQKICTNPITLQGPDGLTCSLEPGDEVFVSIMGIHKDPEIWENPNEFNPDRFAKNSEESRSKYVYLSFGEGPRKCPGMRMGMIQVKSAIAVILKNYIIEPSSKMIEPVQIDPKYFMISPVGGFWIKLRHLRT